MVGKKWADGHCRRPARCWQCGSWRRQHGGKTRASIHMYCAPCWTSTLPYAYVCNLKRSRERQGKKNHADKIWTIGKNKNVFVHEQHGHVYIHFPDQNDHIHSTHCQHALLITIPVPCFASCVTPLTSFTCTRNHCYARPHLQLSNRHPGHPEFSQNFPAGVPYRTETGNRGDLGRPVKLLPAGERAPQPSRGDDCRSGCDPAALVRGLVGGCLRY